MHIYIYAGTNENVVMCVVPIAVFGRHAQRIVVVKRRVCIQPVYDRDQNQSTRIYIYKYVY